MASITGITVAKAQEIEDAILYGAYVDSSGRLVLQRRDGTTLTLDQVAEEAFVTNPGLVTLSGYELATPEDVVVPEWTVDGFSNDRFIPASPAAFTATVNALRWSNDGKILAIGWGTSPYITLWKRSTIDGEDFSVMGNPSTLPALAVKDVDFSKDVLYMATAHGGGLYVYKRTGTNVWTKLPSDPPSLPGTSMVGVAWSPNTTYLAVVSSVSPYMALYKRAGDTFTKLTDPTSMPTSSAGKPAFSNSNTYLAVPFGASPFIHIYKRSGDAFTKLANPSTLPGGPLGRMCAWSPDDNYLVVSSGSTAPVMVIYKRAGDTFTALTLPALLPSGNVEACAWSPDGRYLAVGTSVSPYLYVYRRDGDTFTLMPNANPIPAGAVLDIKWSPDGLAMAVAMSASPYVYLYRSQMGQPIGVSISSAYFATP